MDREVIESPSIMARDTHRIQPAAPDCFPMGPGAHPLCLAAGPSQAQPARRLKTQFYNHILVDHISPGHVCKIRVDEACHGLGPAGGWH